MLAVGVIGLVVLSIYRFVETTLIAAQITSQQFRESAHVEGFSNFLRTQMQDLPVSLGAITGEPHRFNDISSDELRWLARPGSGMLTRYGRGEYNVILTTQPVTSGTGYEIGLRRQDTEAKEESQWYPLFAGVAGFEVRYFDARTQEWVEKWTDLTVRPNVVKVRLWLDGTADPHEMVLPIPYASANAQMPNFNFNNPGGGGGGRGRRNRGGGDQGGPPDGGGRGNQPGMPNGAGGPRGGNGAGGPNGPRGPQQGAGGRGPQQGQGGGGAQQGQGGRGSQQGTGGGGSRPNPGALPR